MRVSLPHASASPPTSTYPSSGVSSNGYTPPPSPPAAAAAQQELHEWAPRDDEWLRGDNSPERDFYFREWCRRYL